MRVLERTRLRKMHKSDYVMCAAAAGVHGFLLLAMGI